MLWCHVQQTAGSDSSPATMVKSGARQIGSMVIQPVMQRQVHACLKVLKHRVMVVLRPLMQACTAPVWSVNFMTYLHF